MRAAVSQLSAPGDPSAWRAPVDGVEEVFFSLLISFFFLSRNHKRQETWQLARRSTELQMQLWEVAAGCRAKEELAAGTWGLL